MKNAARAVVLSFGFMLGAFAGEGVVQACDRLVSYGNICAEYCGMYTHYAADTCNDEGGGNLTQYESRDVCDPGGECSVSINYWYAIGSCACS